MKKSSTSGFESKELLIPNRSEKDTEYDLYVGLDVHKASIAVAIAERGREPARFRSEMTNSHKAMKDLVGRLEKDYSTKSILYCYEAGPCGYVIYHQLIEPGKDCVVIAPSLIPRRAGDRIKTDRRDSVKLAASLRSGDLTYICVPNDDQESMRDLTRARSDMKNQERAARQQLNAFVLRHGFHWPSGKQRWTRVHYNWLESLVFRHPWQQIVLQEYIDAVRASTKRVEEMTRQMMAALPQWSLLPIVESLTALKGINTVAAMVLLSELGDLRRFKKPSQLMSYLGLVPSEHSSGGTRRQGGITRTGNTHARRILIESAWCYRFPARKTMYLKRKMIHSSERAKEISWSAQKRLCSRYRVLIESGKNTKVACVAVARELVGYIWDIVCQEMPAVMK